MEFFATTHQVILKEGALFFLSIAKNVYQQVWFCKILLNRICLNGIKNCSCLVAIDFPWCM